MVGLNIRRDTHWTNVRASLAGRCAANFKRGRSDMTLSDNTREPEPVQEAFGFQFRDGVAVCDRCGAPVLQGGRCPYCHPRLAREDEKPVLKRGTIFNPAIYAEL